MINIKYEDIEYLLSLLDNNIEEFIIQSESILGKRHWIDELKNNKSLEIIENIKNIFEELKNVTLFENKHLKIIYHKDFDYLELIWNLDLTITDLEYIDLVLTLYSFMLDKNCNLILQSGIFYTNQINEKSFKIVEKIQKLLKINPKFSSFTDDWDIFNIIEKYSEKSREKVFKNKSEALKWLLMY